MAARQLLSAHQGIAFVDQGHGNIALAIHELAQKQLVPFPKGQVKHVFFRNPG